MVLNDTICVLGSETSDIAVHNLEHWQGPLIAFVILLIASIGFFIRGLFIYFLTYEAPKERTINNLLKDEQVNKIHSTIYNELCFLILGKHFIFQITQISTMSIVSIMTTVPIAVRTPMFEIFGKKACYVFWLANFTFVWKLVTSGTGMAVYRLFCLRYIFKRNLNTRSMARKIQTAEAIVTLGAILISVTLFNMYGWEKAVNYQECMDLGHKQVETLQEYKIKEYDDLIYKGSRAFLGLVARCFILLEFLIYLWIIYHLWKHNEQSCKEKVISNHMRKERNHKNIITLKGQMMTFLIEITYSIYLAMHNFNPDFADASVKSISLIIASTIVSIVQILTSHEMMRFVRRYLNKF